MKSILPALRCGIPFVLLAILLLPQPASGQTIPVSIVTMRVPDPVATESGNPATFEIDREGPTNATLNVYYDILGTASNGVDYQLISHFATIPAGTRIASINIQPLKDKNVTGTLSVELQLAPSQLMTPMIPVNYIIGSPSNAVAYIYDDDIGSNLPPIVNIISPTNGSSFPAPSNIQVIAKAIDVDGSVSNVELFANGQDLGSGNMLVLDPPGINGITGPVYFFDWTNVPAGDYSLTAVASDNSGATTTSAAVNISVLPPPALVKITSPTNGAVFAAPANIPLSAIASSSNADIVRVDFFADDHFIGADPGTNQAEYDTVWSNAPPGFYFLRAVAVDQFGGKGFSDIVRVAIVGSTPSPLPGPPIVTIHASDPIAVVGTNCLRAYTNPMPAQLNFRSVTNTATFMVRRSGATNTSLTVYYSIGGTASNGVDYAALPGSVTIPAGRRTASMVINPSDENVPECPETVILTLQQLTNVPPPYVAGWPDRAAAVIVDCSFMPPTTRVLCDGRFHFYFPPVAASGAYYRLECSSDMVHWLPVCNNTASEIGIHFTDPDSQEYPNLFYRVIPQANAPLDFP